MKRLFLFGFVGALASVLAGCPIYDDDDDGGSGRPGCNPSDDDCVSPPPQCNDSSDCPGDNETCGSDDKCHVGDCTLWGCAGDQECVVGDDQKASCQDGTGGSGANTGSGGAGAGGSGGGGGSDVVYCGNPDDCAVGETCGPDGTCQVGDCSTIGCIYGFTCDGSATPPVCLPSNPAACGADADCLTPGDACVSGICTAPPDLCFDQTQCGAGQVCANGKCTDSCGDSADCSSAYACNVDLGLCTVPAVPCAITNDCGGPSLVCVDGACVPRSDEGVCVEGVWVENGCIPNQTATFTCQVDGSQDICANGSICLHHSCYISCEQNPTTCDNLPSFNLCKAVTTTSGAHQVCGSDDNLGNECDPTASLACGAGDICVDGFCK